ncbi:hypothetical protein NHQ30_001316 [Ciborinia camelliae]|nr:hypothetical protein NHQ30_001316 [Ciborinia camelliae]
MSDNGTTSGLGGIFDKLTSSSIFSLPIDYFETTFLEGVKTQWAIFKAMFFLIGSMPQFLFWLPIYSAIILILSNLGTIREHLVTLVGFFMSSHWSAVFVFLFVFKFLKVFVNLFSYKYLATWRPPALHPSVAPSDVTVIISSVGDFGRDFVQTVESVLENHPAKILISTVGTGRLVHARRSVEGIMRTRSLPGRTIEVVAVHQPSLRAQYVNASLEVKTDLIAYVDDHVRWPPTFLQSALSEFEDGNVGIVGTCKRVDRDVGYGVSDSLRNLFACIYLERHNYELTATYNLDGGVWIISGRTQLVRTDIVQSLEYRQQFLSEYFLGAGPIQGDVDNFITRYMANHGWKTVFHHNPEAMIYTTLGTRGGWPKFIKQLLLWSRAIWRSNLKTIFIDGRCWRWHPWTSYTMFLAGIFNISILYDPLLFFALFQSEFYTPDNHAGGMLCWALLFARLAKSWPYHMQHKSEMWWALPAEFLFVYLHGAIRLLGLLTCHDISWASPALKSPRHVMFAV